MVPRFHGIEPNHKSNAPQAQKVDDIILLGNLLAVLECLANLVLAMEEYAISKARQPTFKMWDFYRFNCLCDLNDFAQLFTF